MKIVPGPDFPTGGDDPRPRRHPPGLRDRPRLASSCARGPSSRKSAADGERMQIIVTEIPYQVNKATLLERIAELVRAKQVEGIGDMRDESDRSGMRIVIELKPRRHPRGGAEPAVPLHRAADQLRREFARPRRRAAAPDGPEGRAAGLYSIPRGRHPAPRPARTRQGPRPGASAGRAGHRGRQYRRGDPPDPRQPRRGGGAAWR